GKREGGIPRRCSHGVACSADELFAAARAVLVGERDRRRRAACRQAGGLARFPLSIEDRLDDLLRQGPEANGERARADGVEQAIRLIRDQNEMDAIGRLLESLEEGVRGLRTELVS